MSVKLRGAEELAAFLKQAPKEVAVKAGRQGLVKSSGRLRTYIRRAAPMKTGKLRGAIKSKVAKSAAMAWVGLKIGYYYTLEFGRLPHVRKGKPRAGSPQMKRFAFFMKTFSAKQGEIAQLTIDATRSALFKEAGRLMAKTGTHLRIK